MVHEKMQIKNKRMAKRMDDIQAFHVMDLLARAKALEAEGRSIIHMEIGEPDFSTVDAVINAGHRALDKKLTHYTPALGLPELRQAIADYYQQQFNVTVPARRIIITPGASGALHLALAVLIDPGDQVLLADPGYPCNRNFIRLLEACSQMVAVDEKTEYQLTAQLIEQNWQAKTVAAMLATPSNPTGTVIEKAEMQAIINTLCSKGGQLIVDEIYQGLVYQHENYSALSLSQDVFIINSFSKYFGMTGWRLGWMVVPDDYVEAIDRLAQNIYLAAPTLSQHAALACFEKSTLIQLNQRRDEFQRRRDYLLPALRSLGFDIKVQAQGAFYLYADCSQFTDDSFKFVYQLLEQAGVAITPGIDFGVNKASVHCRFAYTQPVDVLAEGVDRLACFL